MELIDRLIKQYGVDEPIFTEEILTAWGEYSRPRIFQLLKAYTQNKQLAKFDMGVYYIPTQSIFGKSVLDPQKVMEKKYIKSGDEVFGYYTGLIFENELGLTTQVPYTIEIVTTKETTRVRMVNVGKARVLLRRAKTQITKDNASILQLLDVLKMVDNPLDKYQLNNIKQFIRSKKINIKDVGTYAKLFPKKAMRNFNNLGVDNAITQ